MMKLATATWMGGAAIGLLVMVSGCKAKHDTAPAESKAAALEQEVESQKLLGERDALLAQHTIRLRQVDAQLAALETAGKVRGTGARVVALERLRVAQAEANRELDAARLATKDTWVRISLGLEGAVASAERAYQEALLELQAN